MEEGKILIFLDMDGVMLPFPASCGIEDSSYGGIFPNEMMAALCQILEAFPSASLVLSSTWRAQNALVEEIIDSFQKYGDASMGGPLKGFQNFYDTTNVKFHGSRQTEIARYLNHAKDQVKAWVALDDEDLLHGAENASYKSKFEGHVVQTSSDRGLTRQDALAAIQLLNNQIAEKKA